MAKKLTLDQIKSFLQNLATALVPGSKFMLLTKHHGRRSKFIAVLSKGTGWINEEIFYLAASPSYTGDGTMSICGIDSLIEKASPLTMVRLGKKVSLDWLVETFKCDEEELYRLVVKSFKAGICKALNQNFYAKEVKTFTINARGNANYSTSELTTIEELYVWVDLHANS